MLKKAILGILVLIVVGVVILGAIIAMQPEGYKVTRSATYNAPPEKVFEQVNDFRKWDAWSPWAKIDPAMKTTFSGPPTGVGSTYAWVGNSEVGEGKMTITESRPSDLVKIDLEFIQPFAGISVTEFTFKPESDGTNVIWTMSGKYNFMSKAFSLVINMDKMIGDDFEKGLAQMKPIVETSTP